MLKKFMNSFNIEGDLTDTRRRFSRFEDVFSSIRVDGFEYEVKDWSQCGVFFSAVNKDLKVGDKITFTLKFSMPFGLIEIDHSATIVRKTFDGYGAQFTPLTREARENFARVMDGVISRGFEQSGIATYH
tara:strand:- start:1060 stop:1449 length:390 start_codon:yes stop_codon:yes gene_type:complete